MSRIPVDGLFSRDNPIVRLYYDSSFRAKMVAGIFVVLLVAGTIGTLTVMQTSAAVEDRQSDDYRHEVQLQNNQLDDWRVQHKRLAGSIATAPTVADGDSAAMNTYLDHKEASQTLPTDVVAVHVVDTSGDQPTVIASTVNETEGQTAGDLGASWATDPLPYTRVTNAEMSGVYQPSYADGNAVAFSAQVEGQEDKVAVVVTSLDEASKGLNSPVGGSTTVVNEEGTIILSTNRNLIGEDAYETGHMSDSIWQSTHSETSKMQESIATGQTSIDGESHLVTAIHVEESNWVVATQTPTAIAYEIGGIVQTNVIILVTLTTLAAAVGVALVGVPTLRDLRQLTESANEVSRGNFDAELDTDRDDEVGAAYQSVDRMRNTLQQRINEVENINNRIETVVDEYSAAMAACADGDLSRRVDADSGINALDDLGRNFNQMIADLEKAVATTQQFGDSVGAASEEATQNIQQVEETSATVADVAQEISDNAARQNEMLDEAVSEMNSLSSTIEEVAASTDEVASQAEQTGEVAKEGREAAQEAVGALSDIEKQTDEVTETVTALHREVEEIEEITDYIQNIAKQTNMLAINAGIEAARAGEAGEGFGVVADEVKQLADDANDAAEDIEESLETIQERTAETRTEIDEMQQNVDDGSETIGEALESMGEIAGSVEETVTGIQEIDDATERQAESAQEVVKKMDSAAEISDDTVKQAEDAAAATQEQSASVEQISDSISHLANQASELRDLLDEFETDED